MDQERGDGIADNLKLKVDGLVWREVGDELVLLDTATSQYFSVNRTGAVLWPFLLEGCQRSQLVEVLRAKFEVDRAQAAQDTDHFLAMMREKGMLQ